MISSNFEIKKQVVGKDADSRKTARVLNRVIVWGRDVITIEAEILKDPELEQVNRAATPCNMEKKKDDNARSDGSKGENQCEQEQRQTQTRLG